MTESYSSSLALEVGAKGRIRFLLAWALVGVLAFAPVLLQVTLTYGDLSSYYLGVVQSWSSVTNWTDWIWNSRIASGYPMLANPQMNPFYPPDWVLFLSGSPLQVLTVNISLHLWILGSGALAWANQRKMDVIPSAMFAVIFMFQGVVASLYHMLDNFQVISWGPWICWAFIECTRKSRALLLIAFMYLCMGAGDPQMVIILALIALPWLIFEGKKSVIAIVCFSIAFLAQPWILAFYESIRSADRAAGINSLLDRPWGTDFSLLATLVFPSTMQFPGDGNPWLLEAVRPNWLQSLYIGLLPITMFWAGIHGPKKRWILLGSVIVFLMLISIKDVLWIDRLRESIPLLSMVRFPSRFALVFPIVALFLFGEAFRYHKNRLLSVKAGTILWIFTGVMCVGVGCLVMHPMVAGPGNNARFDSWLMWLSGDLLLSVITGCLLLLSIRFSRHWVLLLALGIDVLAVTKMFVQVSPTQSTSAMLGRNEFATLNLPDGRWISFAEPWDGNFWLNRPKRPGVKQSAHLSEIPKHVWDFPGSGRVSSMGVEGYKDVWNVPLVLRTARVTALASSVQSDSLHIAENILWHAGVNHSLARVGYRGVINSPYITSPGKAIAVLRSPNEVFVASEHEAIPDIFLYRFLDTSQNWDQAFVLDPRQDPVAMISPEGCGSSHGASEGQALPTWQRISSITWEAQVRGMRGVLALAQDRYPGWRVLLDGEERRPKVVNLIQMGVCLDGSRNVARFEYRPSWIPLLPVQCVFLLLCGLSFLFLFRRAAFPFDSQGGKEIR